METVGYWRKRSIAHGVSLTFYDAGHVPGSAVVSLDIDSPKGQRRLVFSGDLGRPRGESDSPISPAVGLPAGWLAVGGIAG